MSKRKPSINPDKLTSRHFRTRTMGDGTKVVVPQHVRPEGRNERALRGTNARRTVKNGEVIYIQKLGAAGTMRQTVRQNSGSKQRNGRKTKRRKDYVAYRCDRHRARDLADSAIVERTPFQAWREFL